MRILVIEDAEGLADVVKRGLGTEGFAVDIAPDGVSGEQLATEHSYDAIVLDIMLPRRNGYDVLQNLRAAGNWTPILMLSAKDGEYDQADAFDLGADDYLTKPFSLVVLAARLRALIRRGAPERPSALRVGDLTLDPGRHLVARAGTPISLTAKEYSLLLHLMRHAGEAVSKAEILNSVWGQDNDGGDNIVEVYVGYLRKKIDTAFGVRSLRTVRGVGYRLTEPEEQDVPTS